MADLMEAAVRAAHRYLTHYPKPYGMENTTRKKLIRFKPQEILVVNQAAAMAEELVSNFYKMSANQWLRLNYDIRTLADLDEEEIVHGPFAQIIRYIGQKADSSLGTAAYDFYKICLQDHAILKALDALPDIRLLPFMLYIISHELIHLVRFKKFLQNFEASTAERLAEEKRVHQRTHQILAPVTMDGLSEVLVFYDKWRHPFQEIRNP